MALVTVPTTAECDKKICHLNLYTLSFIDSIYIPQGSCINTKVPYSPIHNTTNTW